MRRFRSRGMRWLLTGCGVVTGGAAAIGYGIAPECGTFALVLCGIVSGVVIALGGAWLRQVDRLTDYVDRVLDSETGGAELSELDIASNREGELSVLRGELTKLAGALQYQLEEQKRQNARQAANLADISHQLKTPLTALHLEIRRIDGADGTDIRRNCERLLGRMDWLVLTLLRLARMDSGTVALARDTLRMEELVEAAAEPLRVALELRGLELACEGDAGATVVCDFNWTVEALSNILRNCMEHTPEGGSIRIAYGETAIYSYVIIQDTGTGIPPDELPHIFERFNTGASGDLQRAGIGLALARQVIRRQNGTIRVHSEIDNGTEFRIEFMKYVV